MMAVSFARDIRPLFTDIDIAHMKDRGVALDDYGYMRDPGHAQQVLDAVSNRWMPPRSSAEPPWSPESVQLFRDWIAAEYQP
jgi:hypothetical protein